MSPQVKLQPAQFGSGSRHDMPETASGQQFLSGPQQNGPQVVVPTGQLHWQVVGSWV
ncbi:MAG TPA: hypothetical protein VFN57_16815 [Thermomicrobiaceae bacterium]|nr:hypothetical protein [Thermomicrobiaceae bacterium]